MARRLAEAHVPGNDGLVDALSEDAAHLLDDLPGEVRPFVEHRHQHAVDLERRVQRDTDALERVEELGDPLERQVLALDGDEHTIRP